MATNRVGCVLIFVCYVAFSVVEGGGKDYQIRGLDPQYKARYHPGKDFTCLDGSDTISFSMVNDDYCDCVDGSDEPGTAACSTGGFYCRNTGHRPQTVLSSRVNDGICDCCDGGDEWQVEVQCANTCEELGRKEKKETEEREAMMAQGYQKRVQYEQQGIRSREDKIARLEVLRSEETKLNTEIEKLQQEKEAAEEPERLAKEEHEKKWEEEQTAKKEAQKAAEVKYAFEELDTDSDGYLTVREVQQRIELDDDNNGEVSELEAMAYLDNQQQVDLTVFRDSVWSFISDKITFEPPVTEAPPTETPPPDDYQEGEPGIEEEEEEEDYDYDEEEDGGGGEKKEEEEEQMPPYPEETQQLMAVADTARDALKTEENKMDEVKREISGLESYLGTNLGDAMEFAPLYDQCYEYTDREYTYKLCAFQKVTQRSKNGGRETSLGSWVSWNGPPGNPHSVMLFENGEGCWNGPKRSTKVTVNCGLEETLLSAAEPNRCEYAMGFVTPAVCPPLSTPPGHPTPPSPNKQEL